MVFERKKVTVGQMKNVTVNFFYVLHLDAYGGKGEMSVPVSRAFRECRYRFQVKVIDEFRTTKIFHEDGSQLQNVMRMDTRERLRGLLWCNSPGKNKFVNRDFNGAMNIRRCAFNPRPLELTRIKDQPKLVMSIGKMIKC